MIDIPMIIAPRISPSDVFWSSSISLRIEKGVIAGYTVQDVACEVHFGKHHEVDSSDMAFMLTAQELMANADSDLRRAKEIRRAALRDGSAAALIA